MTSRLSLTQLWNFFCEFWHSVVLTLYLSGWYNFFFPKFAFLPDLHFWKSPVNFWKTLLNLAGKSRKFLDSLLDLAGGTSVKSSCPRLLDTNIDKNSFYHINLIQESTFVQQAGLQLQHNKFIKLFKKNLMERRF